MSRPAGSRTVPYKPAPGTIPTAPGVYRFRDEHERVLYVGKAKNLRQRLSNYFQPLETLHERTRRMVLTAVRVEWTIVASEFEALQLEFTWIKEYEPPFNVQFRDDKSYPYLAVTMGDDVPRAMITRNRGIRGARYFGPYTKVWAIRETLDLLLKAFPMRSCSQSVYDRAERTGRPCLLGDIGKCSAPCVGRVTLDEHRATARDLVAFMNGGDQEFVDRVREEMQRASARLEFERAARLRDQLAALESVLERTSVVLSDHVDADVFGLVHDELSAAVHLFAVRGGRIRGTKSWVVDTEIDLTDGELATQIMRIAYEAGDPPAREVLLPRQPDSVHEVETWLTERRGEHGLPGRVVVRVPQRGEKRKLADSATVNAAHALQVARTKRTSDYVTRSQALADLQEALGMAEAPLRIECFDVSHLGGTGVVASMVVFEDGLPRKDQYRKFAIAQTTDDTDSIHQVITRRARYIVEGDPEDSGTRFAYTPQLLLVDGGRPQVQAAKRALDEAGVRGIALAGIAKRLEELWLPDDEYPVILPRTSEALYLVQRLRDEAHRVAISYQRVKRSSAIESQLSGIPGLGPARVRALLRHFGSAKRVRAAAPEELAEVPGIGPALAQAVARRLGADTMGAPAEGQGSQS
ncbi:excinuclease ABC subunit UvrC [Agrococcus carbonis]|uniref:UvrABC system protein C n=1 Tax=Agrococcus carbonis TaxID=684552 RepID=A0A1H1KVY3_9MICO|nr:excinuclease ABC subunit UvrC [Agrococcus carbonis]SDR66531.1 Excinuclease ABC subunit C [Agrococcus carbonis]